MEITFLGFSKCAPQLKIKKKQKKLCSAFHFEKNSSLKKNKKIKKGKKKNK
jgi:hypothetical protein